MAVVNMHVTPQRTPAEQALIEAFGARMSDLPGDGRVVVKRDDAIEAVKAGLPTRRIEAWHYTDLRRLLARVPDFDPTAKAEAVAALLESSVVLPVLNGRAATAPDLPGVEIVPVAEKLADGSIAASLDAAGSDDIVSALNAAFVSDGFALVIGEGEQVAQPIELQNIHAGGQAHARFQVKAGKGSKATIVERQTGTRDAFVTSISELDVAEDAEVLWLIVQEQPATASHLGQFRARLGRNSRLTLFVMNAGGKLVRQDLRISADAEGAEFKLRGVNLLAGEAHADLTMMLDHGAPHTTSTEVVRNVVTDSARGVFQGRISVAREAQKTDAKMACNTLLLSDDGEFSAKPELEIFADDVACGHGATVTEIDRDHLFYLMARGVPEKDARGLLVKAFLAEVVEELENEPVVDALEDKLGQWFAEHG